MRLLYDILFALFSLCYLPVFFIKGKANRASLSRFGILPQEVKERLKSQPVLWVHAVSVGEIGLAIAFLNRLREDLKGTQFLITTTTVAGYGVAQKIKNEEDTLLYFPADFRFAVRAFVKNTAPSAVALFETELWPNLIYELEARKIPVTVLNGRISDRAFGRYKSVTFFLKKLLVRIAAIGAQDERMRSRFIQLGAPADRVTVTGNLKFDWTPLAQVSESVSRLTRFCRRPGEFLFVAGSTHSGEEEMLLQLSGRLAARHPGFRLLLAPRHLHRLPEIEKAAAKIGVVLRKISTEPESLQGTPARNEVWVLDQMGVLASLYEAADAVFIGGSLVPVGGHNLVEPAYFEKPILFGPFMDNFLEMAGEFKNQKAALEVRDAADLEKQAESLIEDASLCRTLGASAKRLVARHQGATKKNKELLLASWQPQEERKLVSA